VADGRVYVSADFDSQALAALDRSSGDVDWRVTLEGDPGPVAATNDGVFVWTGASRYRLDPADGSTVWRRATPGEGNGVPTVADGRLYGRADAGTLAAWDAATGDRVWTAELAGTGPVSVAVADGDVYAAAEREAGAFTDGAEQWRLSADATAESVDADLGDSADFGRLVTTDDAVYVGFGRGHLAIDRADGRVRWHEQFRNRVDGDMAFGGSPGAPALGDDAVYALTIGGDLYALAR
jgi:outer membrane protein assembly factor BamB